ncbi:MAG: hypothetical protein M3T55_05985 [Pseudomonadota bacterium]|nr:hypothetical protein [Pseudomonadota bacterium]
MTQIHWANPISGDFNVSADWNGGVVPGASDDAVLDAPGPAFTVTANTYETVHSLQTAANATLDIGFRFAATAGTGAGVNAGKIVIGDYGVLTVGGMLTNPGEILMASTGAQSLLEISASTTLSGGGAISLTSSPRALGDEIISASPGLTTLTNIDNTISGTGAIVGDSRGYRLVLVNEAKGVIDANGSVGPLYVLPGGYTTVNAGLIEATGAGRLVLGDGTFANTGTIRNAGSGTFAIGGTIDDSRGGTLIPGAHSNLDDVGVILGGALTLEVGQTLTSYSGFLEAATVTNRGTIAIENKYGLHLQGAVNNLGAIGLDSTGAYTFLEIGAAGATLSGGGSVSLGGNGGSQGSHITGYQLGVQTLINIDNTISGAGTIGPGPDGSEVGLVLVNEARGVIDANGAPALTLSTGVITNSGLIEATGPGGLTIQTNVFHGPVVTVNGSAGGVILAASGSQVALKTATLIGGTLESIGTGEIRIFAGGPDVMDGTTSAIDNKATVVVQNSAALTIEGAIVNADRLALISSGSATTLAIGAAGATLLGGGAVITTANANNVITCASSAATLTN